MKNNSSNKNNEAIKVKTKYNTTLKIIDQQFHEVEAVIGRRGNDRDPEYWIKWKGWDEQSNTWEPADNLENVKHLVYDYERKKGNDTGFLDKLFREDSVVEALNSDGDLPNDIPFKIFNVRKFVDGKLRVKIEWMIRPKNGQKPFKSWVEVEEFKKKYMLMLVDYYESRFKSLSPKNNFNFTAKYIKN